MSEDTLTPDEVVLPIGQYGPLKERLSPPRHPPFIDRVRIYPMRYILELTTSVQVQERLWKDIAKRNPGSHVEPGALALVATMQIVSGLADDPVATLAEKLRLYNGEKVFSQKTYKQLVLQEVVERAGKDEGMNGLSPREAMQLVTCCVVASQNAAKRCSQVITALQAFSPGATPLTAEGSAATVTVLSALDTGDDLALKEWLELLKALLRGPNVNLADCHNALVQPDAGPDAFKSCVSIQAVGRALYRQLGQREQQFMRKEVSPPRKRALQQLFLRACEPTYDEQCQKMFLAYLDAINKILNDIKQREPLPLHMVEEIERERGNRGLPVEDFRKGVLGCIAYKMSAEPRPEPTYTLVPDLQEAIDRVMRRRISDSLRFAAPADDKTREAGILAELVTKHEHCPLCARGVLTQLSERDFLHD